MLGIYCDWPFGATVAGQRPNRPFSDDYVGLGSIFLRIDTETQEVLSAIADGGPGVRIHTVSWRSLRGNPG